MYVLQNGTIATKSQVEDAVNNGTARICCGHGNGKTLTSLSIDNNDYDTRGDSYRPMWEQVWTMLPKSVAQALAVAKV